MSKIDEFKKRVDSFRILEEQKKKQADGMGNLRLVIFLLGIAAGVIFFVNSFKIFGIFSMIISFSVFIYIVIKHNNISRELERLSCKVEINRRYLLRMQSGWEQLSDCGQEFVSSGHPYTADLDIFGPKSLFQWLNTANTFYGRNKLKELLEEPDKSMEAIKSRQKAVKELAEKLDFCQELQSEGLLARGASDDPASLLSYAEEPSNRFKNQWVQYLFFLLPALVILTFTLFFTGGSIPLFIPLILLLIQMSICAAGYSKNSKIINKVYGLKKQLDAYGNLLKLIENEKFSCEYLSLLKHEMLFDNKAASAAIKKLEDISNAIDLKFSPVLYFIINFGLLWDYHCVFALEDWKKQYGLKVRRWLENVGHIEAVASLSVIGHMYPEMAFPVFTEKGLMFAAEDMGHPLIPKESCVRNDFDIRGGACVITGSNMSGKTTLLRTVGINLVLAYSGAQVFAKKLECSIMDVFTSMRIRDDLNSGISTFYAELLRVKMIIDYSQKKQPMLYLIDEIFKGTNSPDRIAGARSVLRNLSKNWIIGLISTHDVELCELENDKNSQIRNYHFTERYVNNEIIFDYKLRHGRSHTTNARYLMKMVGIEFVE